MSSEREQALCYRMARAWEAIAEAELMAGAGHWNACVNRLYYACFYAVTALLLQNDMSASRHTGVRSLFNRHFVRSGLISADLARLYNSLYENRQEADYVDFVQLQEPQVQPWIAGAGRFVRRIDELLAAPFEETPDP